jgi:1-acyl-sn-glycerol-3-phosphate acyltransferase
VSRLSNEYCGVPLLHRLLYRFMRSLAVVVNRVVFRLRVSGRDKLPRDGAYLLLSNHTSLFDPVWVGAPVGRTVHFMAASTLFRVPFVGPLIKSLGAFPKVKGMRDASANARLVELYQEGKVVCLFPEGLRTWDGHPAELRPGIGKLIADLDAQVVYTRILSGHLQKPRWARTLRYVQVELEYSEPVKYPPGTSHEEITLDVARRLAIDPARRPAGWAWGYRLAEGLPGYLWACPSCMAVAALEVDPRNRDCVRCRSCHAAWRVSLDCSLVPHAGDAQELNVATAASRIHGGFGAPPRVDAQRWDADGVALDGDRVQVTELWPDGRETPLCVGHGAVRREGVQIVAEDGALLWEARWDEVRAATNDTGGLLFVHTTAGSFRLDPATTPPVLWGWFAGAHLEHHRRPA